jgi:hypothetical protein
MQILYACCNAWNITYTVSAKIIYNLDRVNHLLGIHIYTNILVNY